MTDIKEEDSSNKRSVTEDSEDKFRICASLAFMTVVVIIGLPMWWKTTEVYRVSLPYSGIKNLMSSPIRISQNVFIYTRDPVRSFQLIKELDASFQNTSIWNIKFIQITEVKGAENAKTPAFLEALLLKEFPLEMGDFLFFEWAKLTDEILVTTERSALITEKTTSQKIQEVLNILILQSFRIQSILDDNKQYELKSSPPQTQYDILLSVLNPRPDLLNVEWNLRLASEMYIIPFLNGMNQVSNYTLKTQWRYQAPFDFPLKQVRDESKLGRHYALLEENLPHIITSIEKNLGGVISDNSIIQLVVYVPPCDIAPLHIYKKNIQAGNEEKVDSFISPKWGGIIILNPPSDTCLQYNENQVKASFKVNSNDVMQIILFHFQRLIDVYVDALIDGVKTAEIDKLVPRIWEYEGYIRRSSVSHILTTTHTLQSLIDLLDNISYIVINDEVGKAINNAYKKVMEAKEHLEKGKLKDASDSAKEAFISSEQAFFDASLLAQLYFPDEQKYAIYIPLFLPIMVPVVMSLTTVKKYFSRDHTKELRIS